MESVDWCIFVLIRERSFRVLSTCKADFSFSCSMAILFWCHLSIFVNILLFYVLKLESGIKDGKHAVLHVLLIGAVVHILLYKEVICLFVCM